MMPTTTDSFTPGVPFASFADLKAAVTQAQRAALRVATRESREVGMPFVRSRGRVLATINGAGNQCAPRYAAEAYPWSGTKRELMALIAEVMASYPAVEEIYIEGGFDAAERLSDFPDGNYEPWVDSWAVTVWRRPKG